MTITNKDKEVYNYFCKVFGKVTTIDGALSKIDDKGYGYYYNDKLTNKQVIDGLNKPNGVKPNCTDICQMMWHVAKALGYDVKLIHVQCTSGGGHVYLKLYHKKNTEGNWIIRDPAAVASKNGKNIRNVWCKNGKLIDTNPQWFMDTLNK